MSAGAAYLKGLPAEVVALSARMPDRVLLEAWEAVDAAHRERSEQAVTIPGIGKVEPLNLRMVWGWLADVVKSRHTAEWAAVNDAHYAEIEAAAARLQGVEPDAIDWDAVPDELFDSKPSALAVAESVLRAHVQGVAS